MDRSWMCSCIHICSQAIPIRSLVRANVSWRNSPSSPFGSVRPLMESLGTHHMCRTGGQVLSCRGPEAGCIAPAVASRGCREIPSSDRRDPGQRRDPEDGRARKARPRRLLYMHLPSAKPQARFESRRRFSLRIIPPRIRAETRSSRGASIRPAQHHRPARRLRHLREESDVNL